MDVIVSLISFQSAYVFLNFSFLFVSIESHGFLESFILKIYWPTFRGFDTFALLETDEIIENVPLKVSLAQI